MRVIFQTDNLEEARAIMQFVAARQMSAPTTEPTVKMDVPAPVKALGGKAGPGETQGPDPIQDTPSTDGKPETLKDTVDAFVKHPNGGGAKFITMLKKYNKSRVLDLTPDEQKAFHADLKSALAAA
jgi:hypothetical protein